MENEKMFNSFKHGFVVDILWIQTFNRNFV